MSDAIQLTTFLAKSTVAQLKQQCTQRELPLTPAKKNDLISRLVKHLQGNPDDELSKVAAAGEEEEEEEEEEDEVEDVTAVMEDEPMEEEDAPGDAQEEEEEELGIEELEGADIITLDETVDEPAENDVEEEQPEAKAEDKDEKEMETETADEKMDDDSKPAEKKGGKSKKSGHKSKAEKKKDEKPFIPPEFPTIKMFHEYMSIYNRHRILAIVPITVADLSNEELQDFLMDENIERTTVKFNPTTVGNIELCYKTSQDAAEAFKLFPKFNEAVTVERLTKDITMNDVIQKHMPKSEDGEAKKFSRKSTGPMDMRYLIAHFVPEGTPEETLKDHFPMAKTFVWARDEKDAYKGMVFLEYENAKEADKEWIRVRGSKTLIGETRLWFHSFHQIRGSNPINQLSAEARARLTERKKDLTKEIERVKKNVSKETLDLLQEKLDKADEALTNDLRASRQAAVKRNTPGNKTPTGKNQAGKNQAVKRPYVVTNTKRGFQQKQQGNQYQHQQQQQRSPRQTDRSRSYQPQRLRSPPRRPVASLMGAGVNQQNRSNNYNDAPRQGSYAPQRSQMNPQATANAVSLLVGLSSILGGNKQGSQQQGAYNQDRYQDQDQYQYQGQQQQGGYQGQGDWVGGYSEGPSPKRSRFSGGVGRRR